MAELLTLSDARTPSPSTGEGWGGGEPATLKHHARELRAHLTDAERHLWRQLRLRNLDGHKFRRQQPLGPYIVDFVCLSARLVIEVDGGQHLDSADDRRRDAWLRGQGFTVLRFWNDDVLKHTESVLEAVYRALHPHPDPPPSRGREKGAQALRREDDPASDRLITEEETARREAGCSPSPLKGEGRDGGEG